MNEVYLQQARKPEIREQLSTRLNTLYLPWANKYKNDYYHSSEITLESFIAMNQGPSVPASLQEIIAEAYGIVQGSHEAIELNASLLNDWQTPVSTTAPQSPAERKDPTNGTMLLSAAVDTTDVITPSLQLQRLAPKPLFKEGQAIPGTITLSEIASLNEQTRWILRYQTEINKQEFKKDKSISDQKDQLDRAKAYDFFVAQLSEAKSIEQIAALVDVVKPFINRHRHIAWDAFTGKNNVTTWKKALKQARKTAMTELLKTPVHQVLFAHQVGPIKQVSQITRPPINPEDKAVDSLKLEKSKLKSWRKQPLFAQHRSNFFPFGRTQAQCDIDKQLKKLGN